MTTHLLTSLFQGAPSNRLHQELMVLVHNDHHVAERLLKLEQIKHPGHPEQWYLEKVIYDLQRDA